MFGTNTRTTSVATVARRPAPVFDVTALRAMYMDEIVDNARFGSRVERTLATIGDDHVALFPSASKLRSMGFDIEALGSMLMYDCIDGHDVARLVSAVRDEPEVLDSINTRLRNRRPLADGRGKVVTMDEVAELGLCLDYIEVARGRSMTDEQLLKLFANVKRGWTSVADANTGLLYRAEAAKADAGMADYREAA